MKLEELAGKCGEWLRGSGPESDIVVSSRIRLARNLADYPFIRKCTGLDRAAIEKTLQDRFSQISSFRDVTYWDVNGLPDVDRQFLVERQLISREHAESDGARGVVIDPQRTVQPDGQRGGSSADPGDAQRLGHARRVGADQSHRRFPGRTGQLRFPRTPGLPDRLPDERGHWHARERDAAPARAGDHAANRKGLPQLAEDQSGRPRLVWRRLPGDGRLLPGQQPDHAGQDRKPN